MYDDERYNLRSQDHYVFHPREYSAVRLQHAHMGAYPAQEIHP